MLCPAYEYKLFLLRPSLVGLSILLLLLQKPKANQRAEKPQVLLPKSFFWSSTKLEATHPCFHLLLGLKITHLPLVMRYQFIFVFFVAI
jgi:hypothetical protein